MIFLGVSGGPVVCIVWKWGVQAPGLGSPHVRALDRFSRRFQSRTFSELPKLVRCSFLPGRLGDETAFGALSLLPEPLLVAKMHLVSRASFSVWRGALHPEF